jgi:hypothetical protein
LFILEGHQGKNCWSFDFMEKQKDLFVLTGGGDCSVRFWARNLEKLETQETVSLDSPQIKEPNLPTTSKNKSNKQKMLSNMKKLHSLHFLKENVYITTAVGVYSRNIHSSFTSSPVSSEDWISLFPSFDHIDPNSRKPTSSCSNSWSDFFILVFKKKTNKKLYVNFFFLI